MLVEREGDLGFQGESGSLEDDLRHQLRHPWSIARPQPRPEIGREEVAEERGTPSGDRLDSASTRRRSLGYNPDSLSVTEESP
jgi:hypothetical protein